MESTFNKFSSNKYVGATKEFLESKSLIAKISFLFLIIVAFIILLKIGVNLLLLLTTSSNSPSLITGMVDASQMITITQDPSQTGSTTIMRSNNANDGIEFTWSIWLFINDAVPVTTYQHVFHKGNYSIQPNGMNQPNNAPGLYINPDTNSSKKLTVVMNTYENINEQIIINDLPINKWFNVMIRCENKTLDVYINGMISNSHILHGIPKQNYGDVYVCANGGFNGYISNFSYYNYALGISKIQAISEKGPNTTMSSTSLTYNKFTDYLSMRWFFYSPVIKDQYNP